MARVLVTGANGFVGSHLAEALVAQGDEVTCLVRPSAKLDRLRSLDVTLAHGDVTDRQTLTEPIADRQVVYHLAGQTMALRSEHFYQVNRDGTRNVAQACAEQTNPPVLVMVSSLAASGASVDDRPRTEADPPEPVSHYGRSKLAGEAAVRELADRVPVTIVRPPMVLGPSDLLGFKMFKAISLSGVHVVPSFSTYRFSVVDARDLAELLILAARRGVRIAADKPDDLSDPRGVYFCCCDEHPTYAALGRMIGEAIGRRWVVTMPTAMPLVWTTTICMEALARVRRRPRFMNFDKYREIVAGSWLCSPQAAKDQLGFSPAVPLAERLRQTAQWYRDAGWL